MNQNTNNLGISMRNSTDIVAHSISLIKDNRVVSLEDYITEIAGDGGNNVDLSNYYTETETDNLLNAKLNVNNPQDILGNLRLDPTNGLSKIILNAVNAPNDEDFYVNGNSYINGEMRVSSLKCDNTFTFGTIKGNFISNNDANTDLKFQINTNDFITLSTANDVIEVDKDIEMHSSTLKSDVLDTWSNASLQIRRNGTNYISLDADDTISISRQSKISSNKADGVDMTVSHHNNTTNLFEKKLSFKNGNEIYTTGDGGVDEELLLNYHTDAGVRIGNATDAYLTIKGARNGTDTLTVNGSTYFGGAVSYNGDIVLTNPYKLKTNEINSNGVLQDLVFKIDGLTTEFLRLQASDFTVRVPNTRSFVSQDITVDNLQSLSFGNDLVLNGGNSTNDAYEEYLRLDASTEKVSASKNIDTIENIYMNLNKRLYLNDTVGSERYIGSTFRSGTPSFNQLDIVNNNSSNGRIRLMINTEENVIIENTQLYSKRVITAVAGVNSNTYNSNSDNDVVLQRNGTSKLELKTNEVDCKTDLQLNDNKLEFNGDNIYLKYSVGVESDDILDFVNTSATLPRMRYFVGGVNASDIIFQLYTDSINCKRNIEVDTSYELKCNTINSNDDNDIVFKRDDNEFFKLDKFTEDVNGTPTEKEAIICSKQIRANGNILVKNLQINQFPVGVEYADFRLENVDSVMRFYAGNSTSVNLQITNNDIQLNRATTISSVKTNLINSNGDNDLVFQRNGTEFFRLNDQSSLVEVAVGHALTAPDVYANDYLNRTRQTDTVFYGSVVSADARVEYMRWNYTDQSLDFNAPIDNTNIAVIGNIVDTTVSDKRLKKNVQDVESNYCDCVKNVKIKTFEYIDEKFKYNDKYGFIAQELLEHLPKEFDNIVKETKPKKDEGDPYLSINYMKLSLVLWGALQEQIELVSKLESRLFEVEDEIKALKGKDKPKAKAKSKNVD